MTVVCLNNPNHKEFITSVIEYHDWLVDGDGNFIKDTGSEACGKPDLGNSWTCSDCGEEGITN